MKTKHRIIKFRAWNIQQKKFINISALDFHMVESACVQEIGNAPHFYPTTYPADENIIMQFTGLLDKNKVEIYEGDILQSETEDAMEPTGKSVMRNIVSFRDGSFGWIGEITGEFYSFAVEPLHEDSVVAGNIYQQNP